VPSKLGALFVAGALVLGALGAQRPSRQVGAACVFSKSSVVSFQSSVKALVTED